MKILITGGAGFIGSSIAINLKKLGHNVQTMDNFSRLGSKLNLIQLKKNNIKNFKADVTNYSSLKKFKNFNLIIDCCAEPSVESSKKNLDLTFYTNLVGTYNILKLTSKLKAKLIFLSSSRIYSILKIKKLSTIKKSDSFKKFTIKENFSKEAPISFYGYSKLSSEMMIKEFSYLKNIDYIINRFGLVAGPGQFGKIDQGVISYWIWRRLNKLKLYYKGYKGSGMQIRDVLHIDDLTFIISEQVKKIDKIKNNVFNIGGGIKNSLTLRELNDKISQIIKKKQIILKKHEISNYDIPIYISNNSKVEKYYNWKPKHNLDKILNDIYHWQIKNKKKLKNFF